MDGARPGTRGLLGETRFPGRCFGVRFTPPLRGRRPLGGFGVANQTTAIMGAHRYAPSFAPLPPLLPVREPQFISFSGVSRVVRLKSTVIFDQTKVFGQDPTHTQPPNKLNHRGTAGRIRKRCTAHGSPMYANDERERERNSALERLACNRSRVPKVSTVFPD